MEFDTRDFVYDTDDFIQTLNSVTLCPVVYVSKIVGLTEFMGNFHFLLIYGGP